MARKPPGTTKRSSFTFNELKALLQVYQGVTNNRPFHYRNGGDEICIVGWLTRKKWEQAQEGKQS